MHLETVQIPVADLVLAGSLYRPLEGGARPGAVLLHGWGPPEMNGAAVLDGSARDLVAAGHVVLSLSMRGWPPTGGVDDGGLQQPGDAAAAVRWLAARPEVSADRVTLVGFSQGGQVALLSAAGGAPVCAVVAWYPVTDVARWGRTSNLPEIRDWYVPEICSDRGGAPVRSPVLVADRLDVPVLLIHGDADERVPTEQSELMAAALVAQGGAVKLRLVPGMGHGMAAWDPAVWRRSWAEMLAFMRRA